MSWGLLGLLVLVTGWAVYASRGWLREKDATTAVSDLLRGERKLNADQAIEIASLKQQLAQAKTLAAIAQKQRNDAQLAERQKIATRIRNAKPEDAAAEVNRILSEPIQTTDSTGLISVVKPAPVVDIRTGGPITELK